MALFSLFLNTGEFSTQVTTNSAVGMIGSFLAAGALIVAPIAGVLIWISQKDAIRS